ncbi:MAG TPA: hypothetical protein DCY03_05085 [Planctomycetaceae bacterium]|nr:hypothetical protein [Planctomycetaceae bacterium]|tara:strand:+ start:1629 stop:2198 length:570 start_codon:yes stop_codon:yes gene_type:complete
MSLDFEFSATHEAGHAVMQWLVGWVPGAVEITTDDENRVTRAVTDNSRPASYTLPNFRKRLLVVFAGVSATRGKWPNRKNDEFDWQNAGEALVKFLGITIEIVGSDFSQFKDEKANQLCQTAIEICEEIVNHDLFQGAVDQIVQGLIELEPDDKNKRRLVSSETVSICENCIGEEFQAKNQWSGWMEGQ